MSRTREEVGEILRARRDELRLGQEAIGKPSGTIVGRIELGRETSVRSERRLAVALGWPADAYQRLLDGDDPATFPQRQINRTALLAALDRIEASVAILRDELGSGA